jgi:hypothetical protein
MNFVQSAERPTHKSRALYPESLSPSIETVDPVAGVPAFHIPTSADTSYLAHGFFRYIGKYPPQIVSDIVNRFYDGGLIVDPMCGGGTTLIEARLRGLDAVGFDVNPVSRIVSSAVAHPVEAEAFSMACDRILAHFPTNAATPGPLFQSAGPKRLARKSFAVTYCKEYFEVSTLAEIGHYMEVVATEDSRFRDLLLMSLFAVLRKVSRANIKKMNLEIDDTKKTIFSFGEAIAVQLNMLRAVVADYVAWGKPCTIQVLDGDALETGLADGSAGIVFLHPPYLTNTAFCEFTQLQLAVLGIDHKTIWKRELRCRGSFLHESNGLKKYLINWHNIIKEALRVLRPGGVLATVVGDGQMDYVRIPVGTITLDFARDNGAKLLEHSVHVLNNNTGRTQSRKMVGQHVAIFKKP